MYNNNKKILNIDLYKVNKRFPLLSSLMFDFFLRNDSTISDSSYFSLVL